MNWYKVAKSKGIFDVNNPPKSDRPIIAWMDCDGKVYYDELATMHGDIVDSFPDISDIVIDGGFIINGKYVVGLSDGGYSAYESESDIIREVNEFAKRVNNELV